MKRGNICWDVEDHSQILRISMIILVIANILLVIGWAVYRWNSKREELRSRMLVLQILTHELRTPIASLSLTVEGFRREFEHLPESVYDEFEDYVKILADCVNWRRQVKIICNLITKCLQQIGFHLQQNG